MEPDTGGLLAIYSYRVTYLHKTVYRDHVYMTTIHGESNTKVYLTRANMRISYILNVEPKSRDRF